MFSLLPSKLFFSPNRHTSVKRQRQRYQATDNSKDKAQVDAQFRCAANKGAINGGAGDGKQGWRGKGGTTRVTTGKGRRRWLPMGPARGVLTTADPKNDAVATTKGARDGGNAHVLERREM